MAHGQYVDARHSTFNDIGGNYIDVHINPFTTPDSKFRDLIYRLDPVNYEDDLDKSLKLKLDGTCEWAITHSEVQNWIARSDGSHGVWICGKPGSGKTIISAALISHIRKLSPDLPSTTLFFFYDNKANDTDHASNTAMLRTFLVQILRACDIDTGRRNKLVEDIGRALDVGPGIHKLSFKQVLKAFMAAVESFSFIRVIIDALDECQNRGELIEFLTSLLNSSTSSTTVRVLLTSRDESDIRLSAEPPLWKRIDVTGEQDKNTIDIERYVDDKIDKLGTTLPELRQKPELTHRIRDRLLTSADGMFLYVRVMFDLVKPLKHSRVVDVEKALASLPTGIEDIENMYVVYFRELAQRAVDYHRYQVNHDFSDSITLRALWWLVGAKRPLRLEEISTAIILSVSDDKAEQEEMMANSREVVSQLLGALVDIRRPRADWSIGPPDKTGATSGLVVTLVHASVKEFLTAARKPSGFTQGELATLFLVSNQTANAWIATRCLSYLTLDGMFTEYISRFKQGHYHSALPLLQYSAEHWADHIIDSQSAGAKDLDLRLALAKFIGSALKHLVASMLCMSVGLPKICNVWGKRSRKASALVDVGLCLHNTVNTVRSLIPHIPDIMAALSVTAAKLPKSSSPPPYAPYDMRSQSSGFEETINKLLSGEYYDILKIVSPLYDTRGKDCYKPGAPRSVQLALLEVVRQFPVVRSSVQRTEILINASTKFRDAALALSSIEALELAAFSGVGTVNAVPALFVTTRAMDMLATLPCLPYVPLGTFDVDEVFRTPFDNPSIARHLLADVLRTPRTGSSRSAKQLEWRVNLYQLSAQKPIPWEKFLYQSPTSVVFSAMIMFGGWVPTFVYTTIALYKATPPLYSFQATHHSNHYRLRGRAPVRWPVIMFIAGRVYKRLVSNGFWEALTWLGGGATFSIGLIAVQKVDSLALIGKTLLFQLLFSSFAIISTSATVSIIVLLVSIVWEHKLNVILPICLATCRVLLVHNFYIMGNISLLGSIEFLWLADALYTIYILVADPAGIQETLERPGFDQIKSSTLELLDIIPAQLTLVRRREILKDCGHSPEALQVERSIQGLFESSKKKLVVVRSASPSKRAGIMFLFMCTLYFYWAVSPSGA